MTSTATTFAPPHDTATRGHRDASPRLTRRPAHRRPLSAVPPLPSQSEHAPATAGDLSALGETHLLAEAVRRVAVTTRLWRPAVRFSEDGPRAVRIPGPRGIDVWLRTWLPTQSTGLLELGGCATAFAVLEGALTDVRADEVLGTWATTLPAHTLRTIEAGVVHDLRGLSGRTISIHAYAPRLTHVVEHSWRDGRLRAVRTVDIAATHAATSTA